MKETCVYLVMNTMRDTTALETVHKATRDVTSASIRGGVYSYIYVLSDKFLLKWTLKTIYFKRN